jgi:hypothetical protein
METCKSWERARDGRGMCEGRILGNVPTFVGLWGGVRGGDLEVLGDS